MVITDLKNMADNIALQYFVFLQKDLGNFHNQRRVVISDLRNMVDYKE